MSNSWSDLIRDGGISAPAWIFFTFIASGIGWLVRETFNLKREAKKTQKAVYETVELSTPTGNGFASELQQDMSDVKRLLYAVNDAQTELRKDMGSVSRKLDAHIETSEGR